MIELWIYYIKIKVEKSIKSITYKNMGNSSSSFYRSSIQWMARCCKQRKCEEWEECRRSGPEVHTPCVQVLSSLSNNKWFFVSSKLNILFSSWSITKYRRRCVFHTYREMLHFHFSPLNYSLRKELFPAVHLYCSNVS